VVCSQRLLRRLCTAGPCDRCFGTGYAGRIACAQIVRMNEELRAMVLDHASAPRLRRAIAERGPDLYERGEELTEQGVTDAAEVRRVLGDPPSRPRKG